MSSNMNPNLGDQFKKAFADGLATGDFRELNILINETASDAISSAGKQMKNANVYQSVHRYEKEQQIRNARYTKKTYQQNTVTQPVRNLPSTKVKNVGQVSSILYMVFGGIGTGVTSSVLLAALICALVGFIWPIPVLAFLGVAWGGSIFAIRKGILEKERLNRMKRYISLCAGKMYVNIADLSKNVGKSTHYVLKDLKKMLDLGFFPEGHLDTAETCFMLDDATFREYLRVEKERKALEADSISLREKESSVTEGATPVNADSELQTMIHEGQDYIRKLHELNDRIPGEVISEKLSRMEHLLEEIFERLNDDPDQMPQMHKLMNYYLPTTVKLLQSYAEFDTVSAPGAEIISAKIQIESTVDTINEAFTELLNKLFQSSVFDATTDAQVLQTMLAKEGLTKNHFSEDKK